VGFCRVFYAFVPQGMESNGALTGIKQTLNSILGGAVL
jgi:hypothetical protein